MHALPVRAGQGVALLLKPPVRPSRRATASQYASTRSLWRAGRWPVSLAAVRIRRPLAASAAYRFLVRFAHPKQTSLGDRLLVFEAFGNGAGIRCAAARSGASGSEVLAESRSGFCAE